MISWIPVTQAVPEEGEEILVTLDNGRVGVDTYESDDFWYSGTSVIAWARIKDIAPYKKEA